MPGLCILVAVAAAQVAVWGLLAALWPRRAGKGAAPADGLPPVSVIVAARDEAANLRRFLPAVLAQDYPGEWEVLVVLDRCTDASAQVVAGLQALHPRLRLLAVDALPPGWAGKKHALHVGIRAARHDCLAFTDADCAPPAGWLSAMGRAFAGGSEVVLGASPYVAAPGLLNALVRHETLATALLYIGLARLGLPYMAVGRSLGYRKDWFLAGGGFGATADRLSGDDDLLLHRGGRRPRIGFAAGADAQVPSLPKSRWRDWWVQKRRHGSAGTAYRWPSLAILSLVHGLHLIFYLSLVVVLCLQDAAEWALATYLLRCLAQAAVMASVPWRHRGGLPWAFPLLDLMYLVYLAVLAPAAAFMEPKWNRNHGGSL